MKIYVIYDSDGFIWERAYTSFESAVEVVTHYLTQKNLYAKRNAAYEDEEERPYRMEKEFTYKDEHGGVMVAHNELEKVSTFIKSVTV
jgi:hypothetical protein